MAQAAIKLDREAFSCAICLDLLKDPVTLSCGHNYCMNCVQNHWDKEEEKQIFSCPQCRQSFIPRPALLKNTMLAHLVEQIKKSRLPAEGSEGPGHVSCDVCSGSRLAAVKSCLQCLASFCETHLEPHYQSAALRKHQLVAPSNKLQENICPEHNEVKKMFCRSDGQLLCVVCCMDLHKGHTTVSAAAERAERQTALETRLDQIQTNIQDKQKELEQLHAEALSLRRSAEDAVKTSEETFTRLIHELRQRQTEVEQQIHTQQQREELRVQELQKQLEKDITELQRTQAILESLALTPDHNQFLLDYPDLTLSETTFRTEPQPLGSFELVNTALSTLSDLLQQTLKEGLENIALAITQIQQILLPPQRVLPQSVGLLPQQEGLQHQPVEILAEKEPTLRKDFLEYSHQITLDPNTNHRQLCLSEGNRAATYDCREYPLDNHVDRFSYYYQVLSREDLTGRCYWEVKWPNWTITIAVSHKAIKRKGRSQECKFGYNDKSWALVCDKVEGYSFYFNKVKTQVSGPISSRIGVYLDYDKGVLSFYSVTKSMNLLHRVQTTFTQPLHAGLKFGDPDLGFTAHFPLLKKQ